MTLKATVAQVLQFSDLTPEKVWAILTEYGQDDGLEEQDLPKYANLFRDKNYCLLIYLKEVKKIEPFEIDKRGFGSMSAWLSVESVQAIKNV